MDSSLVPTKEIDYLDEDKPLRGQNYVCLSFISPEDVLIDKEVFFFSKFIESFASQTASLFDNMKQKYPDDAQLIDVVKENNSHLFDVKELQEQYKFFKGLNSYQLDSDFLKQNDFKTSMRGIKVRGVFETLKEAQTRAEVLKRMGDKFDIYVAQVGCWCPWSPNPEDLQDQEYSETTLNTLMKKYKENQLSKDELYEKRKQEKLDAATREIAEKKKTQEKAQEVAQEEASKPTIADSSSVEVDSSVPTISTDAVTSDAPVSEATSTDSATPSAEDSTATPTTPTATN